LKFPKVIICVSTIIFAGVAGFLFFSGHTVDIKTAKGSYRLLVEIADSEKERSAGLMGRNSLGDNRGMLFVYDEEVYPGFWMKNMRFPLDIVFIGGDLRIKQIEQNVQPCPPDVSDCALFTPSYPVQYVLEVKSGYTEKHKISVGDTVDL
jgi:uncharacterized protein